MKCKNCRNLVKRIDDDGTLYDFCGMVIDSPDTERERDCKYYVVATNADRIRAMNNEELAKFIDHAANPPEVHCIDCKWDVCWKCWKEWLEKEVTDEDEYEWRELEEL